MIRRTQAKWTALFFCLVLLGTLVVGDDFCWTTTGDTGTADENDTPKLEFLLGEAKFRSGVNGEALIRYSLVPFGFAKVVEKFGSGGLGFFIVIRYRDNGSAARVRLKIRKYDVDGNPFLVYEFDSNSHPQSSSNQNFEDCLPFLDFFEETHWIEVTLNKASGGDPRLQFIRICNTEEAECLPVKPTS